MFLRRVLDTSKQDSSNFVQPSVYWQEGTGFPWIDIGKEGIGFIGIDIRKERTGFTWIEIGKEGTGFTWIAFLAVEDDVHVGVRSRSPDVPGGDFNFVRCGSSCMDGRQCVRFKWTPVQMAETLITLSHGVCVWEYITCFRVFDKALLHGNKLFISFTK